jgi:hypothetical protein
MDNRIVKVSSSRDHAVTSRHLCVLGTFGCENVEELPDLDQPPSTGYWPGSRAPTARAEPLRPFDEREISSDRACLEATLTAGNRRKEGAMVQAGARSRGAGIVVGALLVVLGAGALWTESALGYALNPSGCRWSGTEPPIGYTFIDVTLPYVTATYNADSAWDATASPGYFYEGGLLQVLVYDSAFESKRPIAWVGGGCGSNKIWNTPLALNYSQTHMDSYSSNRKKATAVHGFGHIYGLWDKGPQRLSQSDMARRHDG